MEEAFNSGSVSIVAKRDSKAKTLWTISSVWAFPRVLPGKAGNVLCG